MELGYIIIYVPDVVEALTFYERVFGLTRRFLHESHDYGELSTGQTRLAFASEQLSRENGLALSANSRAKEAPGIELALVTEDVPAALAHAIEQGALLVQPAKVKPWGQTVAWVRDLNGVLIELCSPMS